MFQPNAFILSQPRSGSTLLRLHLGKHANVIGLPETHFFPFLRNQGIPAKEPLKNPQDTIRNWANYHSIKRIGIKSELLTSTLEKSVKYPQDLLEQTIKLYCETFHPDVKHPVLLEKSPPHIFFLNEIRQLYPNSKFIFLVRDPRATIASLKNMSWSTSNVLTLAKSWQKSSTKMVEDEKSVIIRYEDLATNPEKTFEKLSDFLALSEFQHENEGISDHVEQKNWNSAEVTKPINKDNLEKWKRNLSNQDREVAIIEKVCREGMERFQYQSINPPKGRTYRISYMTSYLDYFLKRIF